MEFRTDDAIYWYDISGSGDPVVLLHGFTGSSATWSSFIARQKTSWQHIAVDLPGHGKTKLETPRSMEACCSDLDRLFEKLGLTAFHLIGYSMGGRTALSYAMLYPEKIASLVLESASPGLATPKEREARINRDERLAHRVLRGGVEAFVDFWENIPLFKTQKSLPAASQSAIRSERLGQTAEGLAMSLRHMGTGSQPSWRERLHEFDKPVLLLAGEHDPKFIDINQAMHRMFKKSKFHVVKNAGHAIHVEQPESFGKLVTGFINANRS